MAIKDLPTDECVLPGSAACPGCPATLALRLVFKALGMEKKAYHSCIIFFIPMIAAFVLWILILIPLLGFIMSGLPYY